MQNWTAETLKYGDSQSFGSFGKSFGKVTIPHDCCSQPFVRPNFSLYQTITRPLKKCNTLFKNCLKGPSQITTLETSQSPSLDECKAVIRELATALHRISNYQDNFTTSHEDVYSLAECQQYILHWAEEMSILPKISVGQSRSSPKPLRTCWEDYEVEERTSPKEAERRMAEAQRIVSEWAAGLQSQKQGSIPELWLKSKQRFKHSGLCVSRRGCVFSPGGSGGTVEERETTQHAPCHGLHHLDCVTGTASRERVSGSYGSFGSICKKENNPRTSSSQPFSKPRMSLHKFAKVKESLRRKLLELLAQVKGTDEEKEDFTFDESKLIIRELAAELSRVVQVQDISLLTRVTEDGSCQEERQKYVLQWAEELNHSPNTGQTPAGEFTRDRRSEEPLDQQGPDKEEKLKEASKALSNWAWTLKGMEQDSVCPGEDVCSVLQDLEGQWKRGKLPNMLPVMDFIIWTVLQEQPQEGSIAKQWFRSRVTLNRIPDSVWKWISKASANITLDEKTANPSLLLSPDRKRVKMDTIIESVYNPWNDYEMTPKMYNGWWCVLGTKGFNSGRHYWEVGVRGKAEWRIGVVRQSATRQGFFDLSPKRGYWTLRLQLGQLMAATAPVTKLNQAVPSKVGVYLDIEERQVSFYDAVKRQHIYTFDVDFDQSEKIYPLFHTVETDRELVIL